MPNTTMPSRQPGWAKGRLIPIGGLARRTRARYWFRKCWAWWSWCQLVSLCLQLVDRTAAQLHGGHSLIPLAIMNHLPCHILKHGVLSLNRFENGFHIVKKLWKCPKEKFQICFLNKKGADYDPTCFLRITAMRSAAKFSGTCAQIKIHLVCKSWPRRSKSSGHQSGSKSYVYPGTGFKLRDSDVAQFYSECFDTFRMRY